MLELRNPDAPAVPGEATAWKRKDLLDTDTLSEAELHLIMETAEAMREVRARPVGKVATLRGFTVITLFYEQSTRGSRASSATSRGRTATSGSSASAVLSAGGGT